MLAPPRSPPPLSGVWQTGQGPARVLDCAETANVRLLAANARYATTIRDLRFAIRAALYSLARDQAPAAAQTLQAALFARELPAPPDRVLQRDGQVP